MYDQNDISQSSKRSDGLPGGERSGLATQGVSDRTAVPCVKLLTNGSGKVWAVDENGKPLGIYTKSLVAPSKRVHDFILQDQSCKLLLNIVFVIV